MSERARFRYSHEWPPLKMIDVYPNWEFGMDEEGEVGQAGTTVLPAESQKCVEPATAFTAGEATFADGRTFPALLGVLAGSVDRVVIFFETRAGWEVWYTRQAGRWTIEPEAWLTDPERCPPFSMETAGIFPIKIESRLTRRENGEKIRFTLAADGSASNWRPPASHEDAARPVPSEPAMLTQLWRWFRLRD